jgi:hypothetical protein
MDPSGEAGGKKKTVKEPLRTGRRSDADLVEQCRIDLAGGPIARLPVLFQAGIYLLLLAALTLAIVWAFWH